MANVPDSSGFDPATTDRLRQSVVTTYFHLRIAMSVLAFAFPLIFYVYWRRFGPGPEQLQLDSISAFYAVDGIIRDLFVAILCAIASFLVAYRGMTVVEDWLLNLAGACAALIALIPCTCWCADLSPNVWHATVAISFFVLMAIVMLFYARKTINLLPERLRALFGRLYAVNGGAFIGSIGLVIVVKELRPDYAAYVFGIEWVGIWSFGIFWAIKTVEYWITDFERKVVEGQVRYHSRHGFVPLDWPA